MSSLNERINELYNEFQDFPPKDKIVRNGIKDDAFTLLVFEILFNNYHQIKKLTHTEPTHRELLKQYIVPPPDDSIDIFYEEKDLDECHYHIVQVKNSKLTQHEIETCFVMMENSINLYIKKQKDVRKNLKELITNTDFSKQYKNDCTYYVVHQGNTNSIRNQKQNQKIITSQDLIILEKGIQHNCVPLEKFKIDLANNFIVNNYIDKTEKDKINNNIPKSLLCNFSGYDLAVLNNLYSNTLLGRNILYGLNLRESLNKSSKTYDSMFSTIDNEPELFLFYNNGITIISSYFNPAKEDGVETITIKDFSIINGAQTTSTLGAYLKNAINNNELEKIENLKKVFVLTKIYQIDNKLNNHEKISENIKIFNNTQTPLSSRDMVSIRKEQIQLQDKLLNIGTPNIFVNIKKGVAVPDFPKTLAHQRVSNEVIAQLALAGFFLEPFEAKDKKTSIFDNDGKDDVLLNPVYNKLFNPETGILFTKSKNDIEELLFIYRLHEDTKKHHKIFLKEQINSVSQSPAGNEFQKNKEDQINRLKRNLEIANVCLFYNITCYFEIKRNYNHLVKQNETLSFDTKSYYDIKENYKDKLIKQFSELVYSKTINIIRKNSGVENVNNWIRSEKNQSIFLDSLRDELVNEGHIISEKYIDFVKLFKV